MSYHRHTEPAVPSLGSISWNLATSEAEIRRLSRACEVVDGCRNLEDSLLWAALDGRAGGWCDPRRRVYIAVSDRGRVEILVHPETRGLGLGTLLLERGVARCRELGCSFVRTWAYGDKPRTVGWLRRQGFESERVLYRLRRSQVAAEAPVWDPGWSVSSFRPEDAGQWHELHCSLQSDPTRAWTLEALHRQLHRPDTPASSFWLLREGELLRGYLWLKGSELFLFALDPRVRGRGLGAKLLAWGLSRLKSEAFVYCDDERPEALSLYRKFGFEETARDRCLKRPLMP